MAGRETAVEPTDRSVATFYFRKKGPRTSGDPYGHPKLELLIPRGSEVLWRQGKQFRVAGMPNISIVVDGRPVKVNMVEGDDEDDGGMLEDADLADLEARKRELDAEIAEKKAERAALRGQLQTLEDIMDRTRRTWAIEQEEHSKLLNEMRQQFAQGHGVMQAAFLKQVETSSALESTMAARVKATDGDLVDSINERAKMLNEVNKAMEEVRTAREGPAWRQMLDDAAKRLADLDQSETGQFARFVVLKKMGIDPLEFLRAKAAAAAAAGET